jgi:hypothetical protein
MIKLCGFAVSNYYNKVKLALLEKDIPFEEVLVWTDRSRTCYENRHWAKFLTSKLSRVRCANLRSSLII